jgi:hypothetical protein
VVRQTINYLTCVVCRADFCRSACIYVLCLGILAPPLYLFVMIQHGAITFPYEDHLDIATAIIKYFDGTLTFKDLSQPHANARPLFPRLIFIANAALTKWDVRSEFVYIYATVYGSLVVLLLALRQLSVQWPKALVIITALLLSVLSCSPVASNNHVWSLMLISTLAYLCMVSALLLVSLRPALISANLWAAILSWVAAYSISQGLLLFPIIALLQQILAPRPIVPGRWSIFWTVNLLACYLIYIPGTPLEGGAKPTLLDFIAFIMVYIGNPLGSLLWFSPTIGPSSSTIGNGICGLLILGLGAFTAWRARSEMKTHPEARIFLSFAAFACASAAITAWGRAYGEDGVVNAGSSRYSIFAACFLYGLLFYYASKFSRQEVKFVALGKIAVVVFLGAAAISYVRAIPVYAAYGRYDDFLAENYSTKIAANETTSEAYPNAVFFEAVKADLIRLGIGPYRTIGHVRSPIYRGQFVAAIPLVEGTSLTQRFRTKYPVVRSLSFPIVTWGHSPSAYHVDWKAIGSKDGKATVLGKGSISTSGLLDWRTVTISMASLTKADELEVSFYARDASSVSTPIGLPLYSAGSEEPIEPAEVNGSTREDKSGIGLTVTYDR